ncbi:MAG: hydroxyacid dehydrogenase [Hyphomicrobiales bacterium]|nr:hydroxyacid dehydrogenase [Hyphomicrobiales bacterium]MCP4998812.1 hydroxyacid dehydrogenase [Hyphomicrobiales bacterium]
MPHVLVAGKLHPLGREILTSALGMTTTFIEGTTEESYVPHIHEADAVLIRTQPMSAATVAKADRLKIVSRHGVGYDAVDVAALNERGIALAVYGDVNSTAVAEHAAMMILAASKRALRADASVRKGPWEWRNRLEPRGLRGQNLLLLGYGRIGRHTGTIMGEFGMVIRAYDPYLLENGWPEGGVTPAESLEDGLAWADVVSVSVPHTGTPLIGSAEFDAMRHGVVIVNTARGGIVDEAALVEALHSGKVGAAGIDVFESEPLPADHPLTQFDQVLLSPHIAGLTDGAAQKMAIGSAKNIVDFFAGTVDPALIVNREQLHGAS